MPTAITDVSVDEHRQVIDWIGERPETVLAVAALRLGAGVASFSCSGFMSRGRSRSVNVSHLPRPPLGPLVSRRRRTAPLNPKLIRPTIAR